MEKDDDINLNKSKEKEDKNSIVYVVNNLMKDSDVGEEILEIFNSLDCYSNESFLKEVLKIFKFDMHSVETIISEILIFRNKYYPGKSYVEENLIESVIKTNLVTINGCNKKGSPTIIIRAKNSNPKSGSVEDKVSYVFFIFENILKYCRKNHVYKLSIIYDRGDYDKEIHFDSEMAERMSKHKFTKMYNFLTEFIDVLCVMNLNFVYRMMIKMYRLVNSDKNLDKLFITSSKFDLLEHWDKDQLLEEYR